MRPQVSDVSKLALPRSLPPPHLLALKVVHDALLLSCHIVSGDSHPSSITMTTPAENAAPRSASNTPLGEGTGPTLDVLISNSKRKGSALTLPARKRP